MKGPSFITLKYLFSITLIKIILCCFSVGSPILLYSAYSAISNLQILRLINSSDPKSNYKITCVRLSFGHVNGGHLLIFRWLEMWKCNFKQENLLFYVKKLGLVWIWKLSARTVPPKSLQLNSKKNTVKISGSLKSNW